MFSNILQIYINIFYIYIYIFIYLFIEFSQFFGQKQMDTINLNRLKWI